jgi:hypothetical protein
MNSFERALWGDQAQIPIHEASSYFLAMKAPSNTASALVKTAGWQDSPDETGVLEGQFEVPLEFAVSLMGKCCMGLLRLMTASLIYHNSIRGPYAAEVKSALCSGQYDHKHAFEYLVERMSVLAGAPHIPDTDMPPASTDPLSVAQRMIRAEQEMIQSYHELVNVLGNNPMKGKIKFFMGECQAHLDSYWQALPPDYGNKPMAPQPPAHMEQNEVRETPEQEAVESPEYQQAEEAAGVEQPGEEEGEEPEAAEGAEGQQESEPNPVEDYLTEAGGAPGEASEEEEPEVPGTKKASGINKVAALLVKWAKENPSDAELKETGRQRAVTTISAEHHREAARRGERVGRSTGMLAGAGAGAALGHALGKGHPAATLGGAALGGMAGHRLGGELGTEVDVARHKHASVTDMAAAMVGWLRKQADGEEGATPNIEAPMASPTDNAEVAPVNYLNAELMGQQYQDRNEANFYRQQAAQAKQEAAMAQQQAQMQVQQIQQAAAQAQQDAANAEVKVKSAIDQAMRAKDDALNQTQTAAQLRIAQQDMRMKLMELASQDPAMQAALSLTQTTGQATPMMGDPGQAMGMDPNGGAAPSPDAGLAGGPPNPPAQGDSGGGPPGGPAGASPDQQTAPGSAPPAGSPDMNANASGPPGPDPNMAQQITQVGKTAAYRRALLPKARVLPR